MKKKILIIIALFALFFLGAFIFFFHFSTSPQFCRSCHIMEPYYESWKASKHNKVPCVDCHYPPAGPRTFLWRKFQAMSQVVKYVTRTYASRPFAQIDDSACLREGCHSKRLVEGKLTFGRGIKFDHTPHIKEPRRGRHLRCASCHSQIMVGKHLEVTLDTCYLCHFKGMKEPRKLEPLGGCISCHDLPEKEFRIGNIKYNHKDFAAKHGVECQDCHLDVIQGTGDAPKERCYTCHNQPERIEKYTDSALIHENHITKHSVACFHCHTEMTHLMKKSAAGQKLDCAMCHVDTHSAQDDMYAGRGGSGLPDMPSAMYLTHVDCLACHNMEDAGKGESQQKIGDRIFKASADGCVKCHSKEYALLVDDWKKESGAALKAIEPLLKEAGNILAQIPTGVPAYPSLKNFYDSARYNYDFVRLSHPVHNMYYSAKLLEKANNDLVSFFKESKRPLPKLPKASLLDGSFCATLCHNRLGVKIPETVKYNGKDMPHAMHVEQVGTCGDCHQIGRHKEMPLKADRSICASCHAGGI